MKKTQAAIAALAGVALIAIAVLVRPRMRPGAAPTREPASRTHSASPAPPTTSPAPPSRKDRDERIPEPVKYIVRLKGVPLQDLVGTRNELQRLDAAYDARLGITLPDAYQAMTDVRQLEQMTAAGDRYAAQRLAELRLAQGDFGNAASAYERAAALGSPAALTELAQMLEPGSPRRDYLAQQFGRAPDADARRAYIAALVAWLRGHQDVFYVVDRLARGATPQQRAEWNAAAMAEYSQLANAYRARYGRYPTVEVNPLELFRMLAVMQANFTPRAAH